MAMEAMLPRLTAQQHLAVAARLQRGLAMLTRTREIILPRFSPAGLAADTKSDESPVTEADRLCELALREMILAAFAADTVIGEEYGTHEPDASSGGSGFRWILDPIDGTRAFCRGVPLFGTLIGIEARTDRGWVPAAGICDLPALGETVSAALGTGCWLERRAAESSSPQREQCRVSAVTEQARSVAGMTALQLFEHRRRTDVPPAMVSTFGDVRGWSDCYGYVLVATGRMEAMIDPAMKPWDLSALIPIVLEAGGLISGWNGDTTSDAGDAIAGNPWGYERLREIVRER